MHELWNLLDNRKEDQAASPNPLLFLAHLAMLDAGFRCADAPQKDAAEPAAGIALALLECAPGTMRRLSYEYPGTSAAVTLVCSILGGSCLVAVSVAGSKRAPHLALSAKEAAELAAERSHGARKRVWRVLQDQVSGAARLAVLREVLGAETAPCLDGLPPDALKGVLLSLPVCWDGRRRMCACGA